MRNFPHDPAGDLLPEGARDPRLPADPRERERAPEPNGQGIGAGRGPAPPRPGPAGPTPGWPGTSRPSSEKGPSGKIPITPPSSSTRRVRLIAPGSGRSRLMGIEPPWREKGGGGGGARERR